MRKTLLLFIFIAIKSQGQEVFPTIIDQIKESAINFNADSKKTWEREPIFIGTYQKKVITKEASTTSVIIKNHFYNECNKSTVKREKGTFKNYREGKVTIIVDTTQTIKFLKTTYNYTKEELEENYYNSHPVLVKNTDEQEIQIGYGLYIPLLLEAKNKNGQWQFIERYHAAGCGNCLNQIYFKPNEILITTSVIYKGAFTTKLRLRLGNNFSNEFTGNINITQFKNSF